MCIVVRSSGDGVRVRMTYLVGTVTAVFLSVFVVFEILRTDFVLNRFFM